MWSRRARSLRHRFCPLRRWPIRRRPSSRVLLPLWRRAEADDHASAGATLWTRQQIQGSVLRV